MQLRNARPRAIEARCRFPDVEEGLLHRVLRQCPVAEHAEGDGSGDRQMLLVEDRERAGVPQAYAAEQVGIVCLELGHRDGRPRPCPGVTVAGRFLSGLSPSPASQTELGLRQRLREGDEAAFDELIGDCGPSMLRVANLYVHDREIAEEVVQDTWVRVLRSLDAFEGRSSLRTWIFVILGNVARTRLEREDRSVPIASLGDDDDDRPVPDERFFPSSHARWGGMWSTLVDAWDAIPDAALLAGEARATLLSVVEALPPRYAAVFTLRDVEGWTADEVCVLLGLTHENQRVILHRARNARSGRGSSGISRSRRNERRADRAREFAELADRLPRRSAARRERSSIVEDAPRDVRLVPRLPRPDAKGDVQARGRSAPAASPPRRCRRLVMPFATVRRRATA